MVIIALSYWRCLTTLNTCGFFVLLPSVLGELCGARGVSPAPDGFSVHSALHFFGRVPVEASCLFI